MVLTTAPATEGGDTANPTPMNRSFKLSAICRSMLRLLPALVSSLASSIVIEFNAPHLSTLLTEIEWVNVLLIYTLRCWWRLPWLLLSSSSFSSCWMYSIFTLTTQLSVYASSRLPIRTSQKKKGLTNVDICRDTNTELVTMDGYRVPIRSINS